LSTAAAWCLPSITSPSPPECFVAISIANRYVEFYCCSIRISYGDFFLTTSVWGWVHQLMVTWVVDVGFQFTTTEHLNSMAQLTFIALPSTVFIQRGNDHGIVVRMQGAD
jgi:hypothetical protein